MNSLIANYKTSAAGVAAAILMVAQSYQAGMNWKQWASAAAVALIGILAKDHNVTGGTVQNAK